MNSQESLGARIRLSRIRKGLSQAQLALPELSDSYVSLIESGKRTPTPDVLRLLARKLGCSASYLSSGIDEDAQERIHVTLDEAEAALREGRTAEARDRFAELLGQPDLNALPDVARRAGLGNVLALEASGAYDEALAGFTALADELSPEYDTEEWLRFNIAISRCHREKGHLAESVAVAETAFSRVTAKPGPWSEETVKLGATLAAGYLERGDLVSARQLTDRLVQRAEAGGTSQARMAAYGQAAIVAKYQTDFETAVELGEHALSLLGEVTGRHDLSRLRGEYGTLMLLARPADAERARDELQRAMRDLTASSAREIDIAWCLAELARVELALDQPGRAADRASEALSLLGDERTGITVVALVALSEARLRLGLPDDAAQARERAQACLRQLEPSRETAQGWFQLAELLAETGTGEERTEAYLQALSCAGI